jgi:hypothetical protein
MRRTFFAKRLAPTAVALAAFAVLVSSGRYSPSPGRTLTDDKAASVLGGNCAPTLDLQAQGACTTSQSNSCEFYIFGGCIGNCAFACSPTSLYVGGNTIIGSTVPAGNCAQVVEPVCTFTWHWSCDLDGCAWHPGCECLNGSNTGCFVSPNTLVEGCAGA